MTDGAIIPSVAAAVFRDITDGAGDVVGSAEAILQTVAGSGAGPYQQLTTLVELADQLMDQSPRLGHHNLRYRPLCLDLLLYEKALTGAAAAFADRPPSEYAPMVRRLIRSHQRVLRSLVSVLAGRGFEPSGGLVLTTADDLCRRTEIETRAADAVDANGLVAVSARISAGGLAYRCYERGLRPRLGNCERAVEVLEDAARMLLRHRGFEPATGQVARQLAAAQIWPVSQPMNSYGRSALLTFVELASTLGRALLPVSEHAPARDLFAAEAEALRRLDLEDRRILAEVGRATAEQYLDPAGALARLEQAIRDAAELEASSGGFRSRMDEAMALMAALRHRQGAVSSAQYWLTRVARNLEQRPPSGHNNLLRGKVSRIDRWREDHKFRSWNFLFPHRGRNYPSHPALGDMSLTKRDRRLFYGCRDLVWAVEVQDVPAVVDVLARLARTRYLDGGRRPAPQLRENLRQAVAAADRWHPRRRIRYLSRPLPAQWLTAETNRIEALSLAELAWEFAEAYAPAEGLLALYVAGMVQPESVQTPTARRRWQKVCTQAKRLGDWQLEMEGHLWVARTYLGEGAALQPEPAMAAARAARQVLEAGIASMGSVYDRAAMVETMRHYPARIVNVMRKADPENEESVGVLDLAQGLALEAVREERAWSPLIALQHEEREIEERLAVREGEGAALTQRLRAVRDEIIAAHPAERAASAETRRRRLSASSFGRRQIRDRLTALGGSAAAVIYLASSRDDMVAAGVRLSGEQLEYRSERLGSVAEFKSLQRQMWNEISVDLTVHPHPNPNDTPRLSAAYQKVVEPLRDILADCDVCYVVGQGPLSMFPMHALRGPNGRYVSADTAFVYGPSLKAMASAHLPPDADRALVVGHGDATDQGEAAQIAALLDEAGWKTELPEQPSAAMGLLRDGQRRSLVHIIAHGEVRDFPASFLSSMSIGDEKITAGELADGAAHADLVTIAACHLARGGGFGGDLYGFPYAFLASGAATVIAAGSQVYPPYSGRFAAAMYNGLLEGWPKIDAFTRAVRSFQQDPRTAHPVYWAPYLFIGDTGRGPGRLSPGSPSSASPTRTGNGSSGSIQ
ncbi:CHAT domain-containing protein [Actinoplanes sp. NPDC051411]|uniref:CHAT domain-containing protein n=1 Tax=Actinoplanes sp. NPDC051411 TaxID=3155522 RepID=UPI003445F7D1